jgi:hypothetical protein
MASKRAIRTKRIGRPPLGPDMRASTVYLPEAAFVELETLAGKSGKKGFKRPGLSETVRAVIRLVSSREWSLEEIREAFSEPPERVGEERGGEGKGETSNALCSRSVGVTIRFPVVDSETASSPKVVINVGRRRTPTFGILFRNAI